MRRVLIHSVLVVAFLTTALVGCDSGSGRRVGQNVDDASITAAVKAKLAADKGRRR